MHSYAFYLYEKQCALLAHFIAESDPSERGKFASLPAEKIDREKGRNICHQRIAIAQPVFANIKYGKGFDRFAL